MTLTIHLKPELEERLRQQAADQGREPAEYLLEVVEKQLLPVEEQTCLWHTLAPEEWVREFHAWVDCHDYITAPVIPLEALRRENLYEDRV